MYWQFAPDQRMLRTLDWMNDECEASLKAGDRLTQGMISYDAIMSPTQVCVQTNGTLQYWGRPISVLITEDWLIFATKKRLGRRAKVHKHDRTTITPSESGKERARLHFTFSTDDEVEFFSYLVPHVGAALATPCALLGNGAGLT